MMDLSFIKSSIGKICYNQLNAVEEFLCTVLHPNDACHPSDLSEYRTERLKYICLFIIPSLECRFQASELESGPRSSITWLFFLRGFLLNSSRRNSSRVLFRYPLVGYKIPYEKGNFILIKSMQYHRYMIIKYSNVNILLLWTFASQLSINCYPEPLWRTLDDSDI